MFSFKIKEWLLAKYIIMMHQAMGNVIVKKTYTSVGIEANTCQSLNLFPSMYCC